MDTQTLLQYPYLIPILYTISVLLIAAGLFMIGYALGMMAEKNPEE
jgi:hypothetical protein